MKNSSPIEVLLPPQTLQSLNQFLESLKGFIGRSLHAVVLYGGLAKGKAFTPTSDINILLVLRENSLKGLEPLTPILNLARRTGRIATMIAAREELPGVADSFALKFHDILRHHKILLGENPFVGISIPIEKILHSERQSLYNLSLRMKKLALERGERDDYLFEGFLEIIGPLTLSLSAILELKHPPAPEHREEILQKFAMVSQSPAAGPLAVLAFKKGEKFTDPITAGEVRDQILALILKAIALC